MVKECRVDEHVPQAWRREQTRRGTGMAEAKGETLMREEYKYEPTLEVMKMEPHMGAHVDTLKPRQMTKRDARRTVRRSKAQTHTQKKLTVRGTAEPRRAAARGSQSSKT